MPRLDLLPGSRSFRDVELLTRDDPQQSARLARTPDHGLQRLRLCADRLPALAWAADEDGLSSSTEVFMPIQCEYFAMEGLTQMIEVIRRVMHRTAARPPTAKASSSSAASC